MIDEYWSYTHDILTNSSVRLIVYLVNSIVDAHFIEQQIDYRYTISVKIEWDLLTILFIVTGFDIV